MERIAVSLVGAGPGDPGLLTLRAADRLRTADVILHDALVSTEILALRGPSSRLVSVGKRRGRATLTQDQINARLIDEARAGGRVVRLKGGDPFVFGRGGEEALALLAAGVAFEIVPGVCSGIAVPGLAGIPLTHRGVSASAAFVTAHDLSAGAASRRGRERLRHLAQGADTLVIFMARDELARVRRTLIVAGLSPETPAALIESGSTPQEAISRSDLRRLDALAAGSGRGPALLVVGETVAISDDLRSAGWLAGVVAAPRPTVSTRRAV